MARRLAGVTKTLTDYVNVCTTVFTPLEYGTCGLSEEDAIKVYGAEDVEVTDGFFLTVVTHFRNIDFEPSDLDPDPNNSFRKSLFNSCYKQVK